MSNNKIRWLGLGLFTSGGAGLLALTSTINYAFAFGDDTALVMGPSGFPVPAPATWRPRTTCICTFPLGPSIP